MPLAGGIPVGQTQYDPKEAAPPRPQAHDDAHWVKTQPQCPAQGQPPAPPSPMPAARRPQSGHRRGKCRSPVACTPFCCPLCFLLLWPWVHLKSLSNPAAPLQPGPVHHLASLQDRALADPVGWGRQEGGRRWLPGPGFHLLWMNLCASVLGALVFLLLEPEGTAVLEPATADRRSLPQDCCACRFLTLGLPCCPFFPWRVPSGPKVSASQPGAQL